MVENYLKLTEEESRRYEAALAWETRAMMSFPLSLAELDQALKDTEILGLVQGKQEDILRLLELRFGEVPVTLRRKVLRICEPERLNGIFDRAVQAQTLKEMKAALA